jgi:hypothetical protein
MAECIQNSDTHTKINHSDPKNFHYQLKLLSKVTMILQKRESHQGCYFNSGKLKTWKRVQERGHGRNEKPQRCISTTGTRTILDPSSGVANW